MQKVPVISLQYTGQLHPSTSDSSVLLSDNTSKYLWVKGESTIIYELEKPALVKIIEMYQPVVSSAADVGGCSTFNAYGSNDKNLWIPISTYLACKRGDESAWFDKSMTTHITRVGNGDYSIPIYKYIKLYVASYREWTCVGVAKFYA